MHLQLKVKDYLGLFIFFEKNGYFRFFIMSAKVINNHALLNSLLAAS